MQTATSTNLTKKRKKSKQGTPDFVLLGLLILIVAFGVVMVYSASYDYATTKGWTATHFAKKQLEFGLIGIAVMLWVTFRFDYHICTNRGLVQWFYGISVILAISVRFIGIEANGAKRWIYITETLSFQPSELVKFLMIIFYAGMLLKDRDELEDNTGLYFLICFCKNM